MASYEELKKRAYGGQKTQMSAQSSNTTAQTKSSYEELKKRAHNELFERDVQNVDDSYLSKFVNGVNDFYSSSESAYASIGWGNATETASSRRKALEDLDYRSKVIRKWLDNNKGNLSEEGYRSVTDLLNSYTENTKGVLDSFDNAVKYYGQWETEDDYNKWLPYSTPE